MQLKRKLDHRYDKYVTTPEFNVRNFEARSKKINLVSKNDIVGKKKNQIYMKKLATKAELKAKKDKLKKLKAYDSSLFTYQSYFIEMDHKML